MSGRAHGREGPSWGSASSRSVTCTKKADLPRQHRSDGGLPPFHVLGDLLGACNGAVEASNRRTRPAQRVFGEGILRGESFAYVDTQSRPVVRPKVAVMDSGATGEDLAGTLPEDVPFVYPEVVAGQVEVQVGRASHRRYVPLVEGR